MVTCYPNGCTLERAGNHVLYKYYCISTWGHGAFGEQAGRSSLGWEVHPRRKRFSLTQEQQQE